MDLNKALDKNLRRVLKRLARNRVYTVRTGVAQGMKRKGGLGFLPKSDTPEDCFVKALKLDGQTVFDIGGYEGLFTLFFAKAVGPEGRVFTFEPHPDNHARIVENVNLNGFKNVDVRRLGIGREPATATLVFRADEFATGSLQSDIQETIRSEPGSRSIEIEIDSIDRLLAENKAPEPDFIKVDVEGLELAVLEGMSETLGRVKPTLYIEVHGASFEKRKENVRDVLAFLLDHGYSVYNVETDETITEATVRNAFHLYCT